MRLAEEYIRIILHGDKQVSPLVMYFILCMSNHSDYARSGGVDAAVRRYDFERIGGTFEPSPSDVFRQYNVRPKHHLVLNSLVEMDHRKASAA